MTHDVTAGQAALLSTSPAGRAERLGALVIAALSLFAFIAIVPFASVPLARIDAFIPAYQSALVVSDLVTAVLLFGQFSILRSRALLVLAAGYLFTALMAVIHALTFPGLITPAGLLGAGPDTTAWVYMFWHSGFPLVVIIYALSKGGDWHMPRAARGDSGSARGGILTATFAAALAAGTLTALATPGAEMLPSIMSGNQSGPLMSYVVLPVWALSFVALAVLWLRRPHSVLDVCLLIVMCAWIFEIPLSAIFNGGRFTIGYYAGRLFGLLAANFVLVVLLLEISALYARLAHSFKTVAASLDQRTASLTDTAHRLRDADATLEAAFKASPSAIIALDTSGNVMLWNQAAERLFGWKSDEVIGKPHPVVPESERASFNADFARALVGEDSVGARVTRVAKDGRHVELSVNSAPLRNEAGQQTGVFYVVTDLTEQLGIERQLQQAQKMEAVGQLTGGIAHDFNNLLAVMVGNMDLIEERLKDDRMAQELLQAAIDACERGAALTRQLLAFARQQSLSPEAVDPAEALAGMTQLLGRTLGEQVTLRLHAKEGLWPIVVDRMQLGTAVLNLAVNARDAMPRGGALSIELTNSHLDQNYADRNIEVSPGDYVEMAVSDTGTGMPPEVAARAFEPFFTTKGPGLGTGLGLSMVYGFIKQSGGHIKIYSEQGHGTTIKLWLPRAAQGVDLRTAGIRTGVAPSPRGREVVLVVEDNAAIRKLVVRQMEELGYRAHAAADAASALDLLRNGATIDLLFTDIVMPGGMDGRALAREAVALKPGLKVLFTSGFTQTGVVSNGKEPLSAPLLSKPYRKGELAAKLRKVLD